MPQSLMDRFARVAPEVDFWSLRFVREEHEQITVKKGLLQPIDRVEDLGAMITVRHRGGMGYAGVGNSVGIELDTYQARAAARAVSPRAYALASRMGACVGAFALQLRRTPQNRDDPDGNHVGVNLGGRYGNYTICYTILYYAIWIPYCIL